MSEAKDLFGGLFSERPMLILATVMRLESCAKRRNYGGRIGAFLVPASACRWL